MKQIEKVYMVTCGDCVVAYPIWDVSQRKFLDKKLRELGWKKHYNDGWVCDSCVEKRRDN